MNTVARNAVFAESENAQQSRGRVSVFRDPAVSETVVIFDMVETGVDIAELLADTFDEGAHIGAIPFRSVPGDEILAVDEIVDLTVADVLAGFSANSLTIRNSVRVRSAAPPAHKARFVSKRSIS